MDLDKSSLLSDTFYFLHLHQTIRYYSVSNKFHSSTYPSSTPVVTSAIATYNVDVCLFVGVYHTFICMSTCVRTFYLFFMYNIHCEKLHDFHWPALLCSSIDFDTISYHVYLIQSFALEVDSYQGSLMSFINEIIRLVALQLQPNCHKRDCFFPKFSPFWYTTQFKKRKLFAL